LSWNGKNKRILLLGDGGQVQGYCSELVFNSGVELLFHTNEPAKEIAND
jgi:hypothetical protein